MDLSPTRPALLLLAFAGCTDAPTAATSASRGFVAISTGNQAPTPVDDAFTVAEGDDYEGDVLANDTDPDGDSLEVSAVQGSAANLGIFVHLASDALVTIHDDGAMLYESLDRYEHLADGQTATESFTYEVSDGAGGTATATVTMTITGSNDEPTLHDDAAGVPIGGAKSIDVLSNDEDVDDGMDPASVVILTGPSHGTASVDAITGRITYTHTALAETSDSLVYEACDVYGACGSATLSLSMHPLDTPPNAWDDWFPVEEGGSADLDVAYNDDDPLGALDPTTVEITSQPTHGTATVDPETGLITYQHDGTESSSDRLDYRICNAQELCDTAYATVSVVPVNDAPVAMADAAQVRTGSWVLVPVLDNDVDPEEDLDAWSMLVTVPPAHGTTELDIAGKDIVYHHDGGDAVEDAFRYRICDHDGACDEADVSLEIGDFAGPLDSADTAIYDSYVPPDDEEIGEGCGCSSAGGGGGWLGLGVGLVAVGRRRRRQ